MTAKQKANRERFKKVVAEAKKLRAKNKKLTQSEAVKQAWAIMYKKPGKKVGATKIVQKGQGKNAKVTKVLQQVRTKKGQFKGYKRIAGERHTDTKSHNVNIRVVSGFSQDILNKLQKAIEEYNMAQSQIDLHSGNLKKGIKDPFIKKLNQDIVKRNMLLKNKLKRHITELKKML